MAYKRYTNEDRTKLLAKANKLIAKGYSRRAAAREAGVSYVTLRYWLNPEYQREYRTKNREKRLEYQREYRTKNREKIREKMREYQREYRTKNREKQLEYRTKNREKMREKKREYDAKQRELAALGKLMKLQMSVEETLSTNEDAA